MGRSLFVCFVFVLTHVVAPAHAKPPEPPGIATEIPSAPPRPFTVVMEDGLADQGIDLVMLCPAHLHGKPPEAMTKWLGLRAQQPDDRTAAVWICRQNQLQTIAAYADHADCLIVNPITEISRRPPPADAALWPGADHPVLNRLRLLRKAGGQTRLLACIDLAGEKNRFSGRKASADEIRWQVLAVIGGNFQGLVWRGEPHQRRHFEQFERHIAQHAAQLLAARPVDWAIPPDHDFVSVLASKAKTFIVVINPQYMKSIRPGRPVRLPLERPASSGRIELHLPDSLTPSHATTLTGQPIELTTTGNRVNVQYRYHGPGQMIIVHTAAATDDSAAP